MTRSSRCLTAAGLAALLAPLVVGGALIITLGIMPRVAHAQTPTTPAPSPAPMTTGDQAVSTVPMASPPSTTEIVENPYGLDSLWRQGDYVARGTLIVLLIMSIGSWYIIVSKLFQQVRLMRQAQAASKTPPAAGPVPEAVKEIKDDNPFRFIAESGAQAVADHERVSDQVDLHTWVTIAIQRAVETVQSRLQGGLAFLATVGSTAPFVGLFGTVWGIYHALTAIGIAGQASIDKVAGPVGEALIMTAFGLAVAVPAVLGYNWLVRRNKLAMEKVRSFGAETHAMLMSRARIGGQMRGIANVGRVSHGTVR
ncbi:MAG TPA: MotA/TolQ/ExbB proton channel family protein [Burkholderiales bacterium]|nr:MotA/TolQ/ExbB proton channel family protein [Burkholderiales bacterium]